jgi:hypothetical protein
VSLSRSRVTALRVERERREEVVNRGLAGHTADDHQDVVVPRRVVNTHRAEWLAGAQRELFPGVAAQRQVALVLDDVVAVLRAE